MAAEELFRISDGAMEYAQPCLVQSITYTKLLLGDQLGFIYVERALRLRNEVVGTICSQPVSTVVAVYENY